MAQNTGIPVNEWLSMAFLKPQIMQFSRIRKSLQSKPLGNRGKPPGAKASKDTLLTARKRSCHYCCGSGYGDKEGEAVGSRSVGIGGALEVCRTYLGFWMLAWPQMELKCIPKAYVLRSSP